MRRAARAGTRRSTARGGWTEAGGARTTAARLAERRAPAPGSQGPPAVSPERAGAGLLTLRARSSASPQNSSPLRGGARVAFSPRELVERDTSLSLDMHFKARSLLPREVFHCLVMRCHFATSLISSSATRNRAVGQRDGRLTRSRLRFAARRAAFRANCKPVPLREWRARGPPPPRRLRRHSSPTR